MSAEDTVRNFARLAVGEPRSARSKIIARRSRKVTLADGQQITQGQMDDLFSYSGDTTINSKLDHIRRFESR